MLSENQHLKLAARVYPHSNIYSSDMSHIEA